MRFNKGETQASLFPCLSFSSSFLGSGTPASANYWSHISNVEALNGHLHPFLLRASAFLSTPPVTASNQDLFSVFSRAVGESSQHCELLLLSCQSSKHTYFYSNALRVVFSC